MQKTKIKTIVAAAPGWFSVYKEDANGSVIKSPVALWVVLIDQDGDEIISSYSPPLPGQDGYIDKDYPDCFASNFSGWLFEKE